MSDAKHVNEAGQNEGFFDEQTSNRMTVLRILQGGQTYLDP
jgi:hypothetical protein